MRHEVTWGPDLRGLAALGALDARPSPEARGHVELDEGADARAPLGGDVGHGDRVLVHRSEAFLERQVGDLHRGVESAARAQAPAQLGAGRGPVSGSGSVP